MDIVQITDTASYGTPKAQEETLVLGSTNPNRHRRVKQWISWGFRLSDRLSGTVPSMWIEVVIEKEC
jgi:hypothetical protein